MLMDDTAFGTLPPVYQLCPLTLLMRQISQWVTETLYSAFLRTKAPVPLKGGLLLMSLVTRLDVRTSHYRRTEVPPCTTATRTTAKVESVRCLLLHYFTASQPLGWQGGVSIDDDDFLIPTSGRDELSVTSSTVYV